MVFHSNIFDLSDVFIFDVASFLRVRDKIIIGKLVISCRSFDFSTQNKYPQKAERKLDVSFAYKTWLGGQRIGKDDWSIISPAFYSIQKLFLRSLTFFFSFFSFFFLVGI